MSDWKLIFVLPNLQIASPIDCEYIALVPSHDERWGKIAEECFASKVLLTKFVNPFGTSFSPCALILRDDAPTIYRQYEIMTDFRNIIAICSILKAYTQYVNGGHSTQTIFSNHFDLYPITPSVDGKYLVPSTPLIRGLDDPAPFIGQVSPLIVYPNFRTARPDENILELLLNFWINDLEKTKWESRAIFRSLHIAYQATTLWPSFLGFDSGSSIGLWISAFEILVHSGNGGRAGLKEVLGLLGSFPFAKKALSEKNYSRQFDRAAYPMNLIQEIYCQLYDSRNTYLHGNPIENKHKYFLGQETNHQLLTFAPFLYRAALITKFIEIGINIKRDTFAAKFDEVNFEVSILKCVNNN